MVVAVVAIAIELQLDVVVVAAVVTASSFVVVECLLIFEGSGPPPRKQAWPMTEAKKFQSASYDSYSISNIFIGTTKLSSKNVMLKK